MGYSGQLLSCCKMYLSGMVKLTSELLSPHLPLDPITISNDYGQAGAAGAWTSPQHPPGPQDLSGTTGRTEQRTPPPNPLGSQYFSGTTGRPELHSESRRTNNCYCATALLDWQTYNAGYIHMGIGQGLLKSAVTPLDWTTRAALPYYADRRRRSGAGLTRVGTG